ncbi:hypothetical protein [uncultured Cellulomonas sp.]|uniref:hypothetical protein n=1 Tax=uncultured Cellulomonas sp. TaxID=189682 RepID=UPI0028E3A9F8|nr:hypothetical protein [uncultured Cellulomonas sp.]
MLSAEWIEHVRPGDRERLGWIRPDGDAFAAVDVLGRDLTGPVEWLEAEEALEERGLGWLSDLWELDLPDGTRARVRIVEVTPDRVVVQTDDFGAVDVDVTRHVLEFPAPDTLRPFEGDASVMDAFGHSAR